MMASAWQNITKLGSFKSLNKLKYVAVQR